MMKDQREDTDLGRGTLLQLFALATHLDRCGSRGRERDSIVFFSFRVIAHFRGGTAAAGELRVKNGDFDLYNPFMTLHFIIPF